MNKKITVFNPSTSVLKSLDAADDTHFYVGDFVIDVSGSAGKAEETGGVLIGYITREQEVKAGQSVEYESGYILLPAGTGTLEINKEATINGVTGVVDATGGNTGAVVRGFQSGQVMVEVGNLIVSDN